MHVERNAITTKQIQKVIVERNHTCWDWPKLPYWVLSILTLA